MKQEVIIIGHGYSSRLGMIRSFGECGFDVNVVVIAKPSMFGVYHKQVDYYSKYVNRYLYSKSGDREGLIRLLLKEFKSDDSKPTLIPDSDFAASTIDLYQDRLKDYFLYPTINSEQGKVVYWMNKLHQKNLASEIGLNVVPGKVIKVSAGTYEIPKDINYPCFPKPLASAYGGKLGLRKCPDQESLYVQLNKFTSRDVDVLVENYINIEKEYAVVGFANSKRVEIPAVIYLSSKGSGTHIGVAKNGQLISKAGFDDLLLQFEQFVSRLNFVGLFDIDFFEAEGKFYFGELNLRYGASGYSLYKMGINLPLQLYKALNNKPIDSIPNYTDNLAFMNERVCVDDWLASDLPISFIINELDKNKEKGFVFSIEDPNPYRHLIKKTKRAYILKRIKKLFRA